MDLLNRLRNICRYGLITGGETFGTKFPVQQITYLGKTADCATLFPYGMFANASSNDSLIAFFAMGGDENNRLGIPYTPEKRPRDLAQGEVAFYHPETDSFIKFRNSGNLEIESGNSGTGEVVIKSSKVTIDSPETTFTGDVVIEGEALLGKASDTPLPIARKGDLVSVSGSTGSIVGGSTNHKAT